MSALSIAKTIVTFTSAIGASTIVTAAIRTTVPQSTNVLQKVAVGAGSFAISGLVGSKVLGYTGREFDGIVEIFKNLGK